MGKQRVFIPYEKLSEGPGWTGIIITFCIGLWPITAILGLKKYNAMKKRRMRDNMMNLANALDERDVISTVELAVRVGRPRTEVENDLQEMINRGYMPRGSYVDRGRRQLVFGTAASGYAPKDIEDTIDDIANMVGAAVGGVVGGVVEGVMDGLNRAQDASRRGRRSAKTAAPFRSARTDVPEQPAAPVREEPKREEPAKPGRKGALSPELEATLTEIRELNAQIADEAVSRRIDRIEELTRSIFSVVSRHPEKADDVRRFMNYYLPTTLKLLNTYALMEEQSYQGENITASRRRIEEILDTLISAFERQQDEMFGTDAFDVAADIDVLQTMLKKDGLVSDGMDIDRLRKGGRAAGGH